MHRSIKGLLAATAAGLLVVGAAVAQEGRQDADRALGADATFVKTAASSGQLEVRLGELAQRNAANAAVRQFGARMVRDHTMANRKLMTAISTEGRTPPRPIMIEKHRLLFNRLAKLSGAEFDRDYMKHMVEDHKEAVALFQKEAKDGKDAKVKAFAEETLPHLKEHLEMAQKTYDQVKGGGKEGGKERRKDKENR